MLRSLQLTNFKPFASPPPIRLAPVTLVYGPNSGGKSSLIQSLLLLKQTLTPDGQTYLVTRGRCCDLGTFESLVHRHDVERPLSFELQFLPFPPVIGRPHSRIPPSYVREVGLTYERFLHVAEIRDVHFRLADSGEEILNVLLRYGQAVDLEMAYDFDEANLSQEPGNPGMFVLRDDPSRRSLARYLARLSESRGARRARRKNVQPTLFAEVAEPALTVEAAARAVMRAVIMERDGLPARLTFPGRMRIGQTNAQAFDALRSISEECRGMLANVTYLGPLRSYPARHYVSSGQFHSSVGTAGENAPEILNMYPGTVSSVNEWFKVFEIPYDIIVEQFGNEFTGSMFSLVLTDSRNQVAVAPSDVGFGIGQLLPILVEGVVSSGKVLCVEQPEIHLHPRLQAHLADFFIDTAGLGGGRQRSLFQELANHNQYANQWICETHSETLMLRLQRRIREGVIHPHDVSVLYVEPGPEGSKVTELRLDEKGGFIDEWPDGFFEEDMQELFGKGE